YAPHFESQAVVFAFLSAPASKGSWLISSACSAVLVGAHYREPRRDGKRKTTKNDTFLLFSDPNAYLSNKTPRISGASTRKDAD
ncbi:hypothetical protein ACEUEG_19125, partial [Aeromonas media]|uniref:hypothetical protein n=1 Tax=Aeromonas media TaxID=651 RepID=UPI0038CFBDE3